MLNLLNVRVAGAGVALSVLWAVTACDGGVTWSGGSASDSNATAGAGAGGGPGTGPTAGGAGSVNFTGGYASSAGGSNVGGSCDRVPEGEVGTPGSVFCAKCEYCAIAGPCDGALEACEASPECVAYYECRAGNCGECEQCDVQNPAGKEIYDALIVCLRCTCPLGCGTEETCEGS